MENKTALSAGVMLNAYPDSMGGTLADIVALLGRGEMKGAFDAFYILPSIFNTDLDRGFSVIDYNLNECYAGQADLDALRKLGIDLKFDLILNHASVLSPQFQDLLKNGENSRYKDFFINWNKFWEGHGQMTQEGYIQPDAELIRDMFFRKPGLPILMVRMPDGSEVPYWNTFYQEVRYREVDASELVESCSGHVDYLDTHSVTQPQESEKVDDGQRRVELSTDFSFALDGENYWCFMTLVKENDFNEAEVGVSTIIVWSEDAYSAMLYDARGTDWPDTPGLHLELSYPLQWETRLVNDDPLRYEAGDAISDVDEVAAFLDEGEKTVDDFEGRFGQPCCVSWTGDGHVYYELAGDGEDPRYLEVNATVPDEPIYSAYVVGERGVVEKVWDEGGDA